MGSGGIRRSASGPARGLRAAAAAAVISLVSLAGASADTIQLKDGRFFNFGKIHRVDRGYRIPFKHGDVVIPDSMVLTAVLLSESGEYEPKDEKEKEKVAKGLVPFEGKWIKKADRDKILKDRNDRALKFVDDLKKHQLWRNRYVTQTPHFIFEYTISPDICENFRNLMEAYFGVFAKSFGVAQTPQNGGKLKVCFYHDEECYYEVSGAPRGAVGYFKFVDPLELNFFYDRTDEYETTAILFHECNHYLVHLINPSFVYPPWLAEGMAENYGASEWDPGKKSLKTGLVQEGRVVVLMDALAGGEVLRLEDMMRIGDFDAIHYAWGWSFVHMLMENQRLAGPFLKYFVHLATNKAVKRVQYGSGKQTVAPDEAVMQFKSFMKLQSLDKIEEEWIQYVKNLKVATGRGYSLAGDWAMRWGLKHKAIKYFKTAIEKGLEAAHVYERLGRLLLDKEKSDEGVEAFRKAIALEPLNARLYMRLGNALYERDSGDDRKEGERLMRLALEIDPDDAYLRFEAKLKDLRKE